MQVWLRHPKEKIERTVESPEKGRIEGAALEERRQDCKATSGPEL